jgi:hypothetical protein
LPPSEDLEEEKRKSLTRDFFGLREIVIPKATLHTGIHVRKYLMRDFLDKYG